MADLLQRAPMDNVSVEFIDRLLTAFGVSQQDAKLKSSVSPVAQSARPLVDKRPELQPFVDALTNRELETLQLLAERLYDKEIAKTLSISVWTVRTHVKHIFEKLHVSNRRQAVVKAEELGSVEVGSKGPLKLSVESCAFVVAQKGLVGGLAPRKLETKADRLCHVPEQIAENGFVSHGARQTDVTIDWIIDPIADVAVQTRIPVDKHLQPTARGSDTFQRVNTHRLQDSTAVSAESLAHVAFARDAKELVDFPAEVGTDSPNICHDAIARSGRRAAQLSHNSGDAKFQRSQLVRSCSAKSDGNTELDVRPAVVFTEEAKQGVNGGSDRFAERRLDRPLQIF